MHADRRRGRPNPRVLYWFRTPPGVRVGRAPLDEEAIRLIEQSNPGVEFDWTRMLKGQDAPPPPRPTFQHERRARPRPPRETPTPFVRGAAPSGESPGSERSPAEAGIVVSPLPVTAVPELRPDPRRDEQLVPPSSLEPLEQAAEQVAPRSSATAASARLGSEGLARLRARHAEVLARIAEKAPDPSQREQLKAAAERLNPDTWVTEAEVAAGLESYEAVFESLRGVIGHRRNRRKRRPGGAEQAGEPENAPHRNEPGPS